VFQNLAEPAAQSRLLIAQKISAGKAVTEGCVAYTHQYVVHPDPVTGRSVRRRVTMLRILNVRESPHRAEIARRLSLEAQLRSTVRGLYDKDEPEILGTLGVMMAGNDRALKWASLLRPRVTILPPGAFRVRNDPVLASLRRWADRVRFEIGGGERYRFIIGNRISLFDAVRLNAAGQIPHEPGSEELHVSYDPTDPFEDEIKVAAASIRDRNPKTLARLGLNGDPKATVWGPPEASAMRVDDIEEQQNPLESSGK
jgi:hypothetical protein